MNIEFVGLSTPSVRRKDQRKSERRRPLHEHQVHEQSIRFPKRALSILLEQLVSALGQCIDRSRGAIGVPGFCAVVRLGLGHLRSASVKMCLRNAQPKPRLAIGLVLLLLTRSMAFSQVLSPLWLPAALIPPLNNKRRSVPESSAWPDVSPQSRSASIPLAAPSSFTPGMVATSRPRLAGSEILNYNFLS